MADLEGLSRLIEPEVKSLGYDLVRVCMTGGTSDPTLQVMAERPDTRQLDLSDCEKISRRLSDMLLHVVHETFYDYAPPVKTAPSR